jgi:hypothetical protein
MTGITVKAKVLRALEDIPANADYDDVMERIYILQKVERGKHQIEEGEGIPHEEAKRRIKKWHE